MLSFFRYFFGAAVLWILCWGIYSDNLRNGFLLDDEGLIVDKTAIHDLRNIPTIFKNAASNDFQVLGFYRPVSEAFRACLYSLFQKQPRLYHLTNILLFYFFCLLIFFLIKILVNREKLALLTTVLFCVHPLNSTPVCYI